VEQQLLASRTPPQIQRLSSIPNLSGMRFKEIKLFGMTQMEFNTLTTIQSFMVEQDKPLRLEFGH
jgi:hypothetical protein